jgi:hypothetical protein
MTLHKVGFLIDQLSKANVVSHFFLSLTNISMTVYDMNEIVHL